MLRGSGFRSQGFRDYTGVILGLHWGYIGIMEKKLENYYLGFRGFRVLGPGLRVCNLGFGAIMLRMLWGDEKSGFGVSNVCSWEFFEQ